MSEHIDNDRLQDAVDGQLDPAAVAAIEQHTAVCDECRSAFASLRRLRGELQSLPRAITPPRDLRAGIWQRVDRDDGAVIPLRPAGRVPPRRWLLAAAAVALMALSSAATFVVMELRGGGASDPAAAAQLASTQALEARYVTATSELEKVVQEQRAQLSPTTVRLLEENLRIIDRALAEARQALQSDPGNTSLSRMLLAVYEKKLDLLRSATQGNAGI